jgi:Protein of unknown function DUF262
MSPSRPALKVTPFDARTLTWWHSRAARIDMDPPYQRRGRLWSPSDKAYLIDSIINGFDVPKLYIADFTYADSRLNQKQLPYAIIDGKQRLEAIFDFFDGKIVLNADFTFLEDRSLRIGGLGYRDLRHSHPEIAEIFENYNLTVMSVITDNQELINELFVRLNRSKPLTGAEIRNAMNGPAPEIIRQLSRHEFFSELIAFPVNRGQDLNAGAKFLLFEFAEAIQETKKTTLDSFVKTATLDPSKLELATRRTRDTLDSLATIFLPRDRLLASAGILPVYYWLVRNLNEDNYPYIRQFLVEFEEKRRSNRRLAEESPLENLIDRQLIEFDAFNRNTNDLSSHVGRVNILASRFQQAEASPRGPRPRSGGGSVG